MVNFEEWWKKESGWGGEMLSEGALAESAWNKALELAEKQVKQIAMDHNTIVYAASVINRNRTDKVNE